MREEDRAGGRKVEPDSASARTAPIGGAEMLRLARTYILDGRWREADALYQRVLAIHRHHAEALHGRGIVAARLGRLPEAITLLKRAIAARHDLAPAHLDLARAFRAVGQLQEALAAARRAVRFAPGSAAAHLAVGELLEEQGNLVEALTAHARAAELDPENAEPRLRLGLTFQQLGRLDEAALALTGAIEHAPARANLHYSLGTVLHGLHRLDDAVEAYERALRLRPALAESLFELGKPRHIHALLERGECATALERLDRFLRTRPGQSCALALKAVVLDDLGQREAARELVDFSRLIKSERLEAPEPGGIGELNAALARHILHHPTLRPAPASFSVHGGKTTGELLAPPLGPMRAFENLVRAAVQAYAAGLPNDPSHPFIANRPRSWRLNMWANIIEAEGFQVPHIHPSGWLSAVYYVRVPEVVRSQGQSGWIEFGEPYSDVVHRMRPETVALEPEAGLLLLFPSYFYHRTLPFSSGEQRISIAFDAVPCRS